MTLYRRINRARRSRISRTEYSSVRSTLRVRETGRKLENSKNRSRRREEEMHMSRKRRRRWNMRRRWQEGEDSRSRMIRMCYHQSRRQKKNFEKRDNKQGKRRGNGKQRSAKHQRRNKSLSIKLDSRQYSIIEFKIVFCDLNKNLQ